MSNYNVWNIAGPATWPLWLLAAGSLCLFIPRVRAQAMVRPLVLASLTLFIAMALLPTGSLLSRPLETRFPAAGLKGLSVTDIVVLAGAEALRASAAVGRLETGG